MLKENIERILEEIKPYLQADDGWKYLSRDFWIKAE